MSSAAARRRSTAEPDYRKLMELAVTVMRNSIHERRGDGKESPLVSAVLWRPDGAVESASRGELRSGDHAEYTLLERKNRNQCLDGAIVFATLEPCAPGARKHPKLSCAERMVLARVREVWVGIEDPDPSVDRKGIRYLQENGISVRMFDADLQEAIRKANREFLRQAVQRAEKARSAGGTAAALMPEIEDPSRSYGIEDLSRDALERYRAAAGIKDRVSSPSFQRSLSHLGILKAETVRGREMFRPAGWGVLLFGQKPREVFPQAGLLATVEYPNGEQETRDFEQPLVLIPNLVEDWLKSRLPSIIDRSRMRREERQPMPFELVREALVNALVHRDYRIKGAKCQVVVASTKVTVSSPGGPTPPITIEQLQALEAPALSRNPVLHYVFSRMKLAEERGLGMKTFRSFPPASGLPLPAYSQRDPYLDLTIFRNASGAIEALPRRVREALSNDEQAGWQFLASMTTVTKSRYAEHFRFDDRKAQRHLKRFVELGLLRRTGSGPATSYDVVRSRPDRDKNRDKLSR